MSVKLSDVTLVSIYNENEALTQRAVRLSKAQCQFGGQYVRKVDLQKQGDYDYHMTCVFPVHLIQTSHVLVIQYDGYVLNAKAWNPSWLEYDYIGAVWPWHPEHLGVGNGGFSLRSRRLMVAVRDLTERWSDAGWRNPMPDDVITCHALRFQLEGEGFRFAPRAVAEAFSFERGTPKPKDTFGFHGLFNLPHIMPVDEFYRDFDPHLARYVKNGTEYRETLDNYAKEKAA